MKHGYWVYSLLIGCMESCYDLMTKFRAHNPKPTNMVNEFVSEVRRNFLWVSREEMAEKDWFAQEPTTSDSNIPSKNYFNSVGKDTSRYVQKFKRSLCHWPFILASQSLTEALKSCLKSFYVSAIKQDDTFYKKKKVDLSSYGCFLHLHSLCRQINFHMKTFQFGLLQTVQSL